MGFTIETGISGVTVFLQGLLSFFSPCVLPLVPLYIGYLAGGAKTVDEDGVIHYRRSKVIVNTLFFVLGVSFAFFLLGFGFTAVGKFFSGNRVLFARIGGVLVILFGVLQLFGSNVFTREHRLPFRLSRFSMNPAVALILGFTFSFAWTPCVGPALTSVLLMAGSSQTSLKGFLLIGVYTLGFILPFLAAGIFTAQLLGFFRKHMKVVRYTVKIGGVLLILMGVLMFTGKMNDITGYLSMFQSGAEVQDDQSGSGENNGKDGVPAAEEQGEKDDGSEAGNEDASAGNETAGSNGSGEAGNGESASEILAPGYDLELADQFGEVHTLSEYKGKVIFAEFLGDLVRPLQK